MSKPRRGERRLGKHSRLFVYPFNRLAVQRVFRDSNTALRAFPGPEPKLPSLPPVIFWSYRPTCRWVSIMGPCLRRTVMPLLILLLGMCVPVPVGAQSQSDQNLWSLSLEDLSHVKVYSASRHAEEIRDSPSSVSIITVEEILRYGWRTLAYVLGSLRGFYSSYDRNYSYLGVRGVLRPGDFNSRVLLQVNGYRLNDNVYGRALRFKLSYRFQKREAGRT